MSIRHEREARLANGFEDGRIHYLGGIPVSKEAADRFQELQERRLREEGTR